MPSIFKNEFYLKRKRKRKSSYLYLRQFKICYLGKMRLHFIVLYTRGHKQLKNDFSPDFVGTIHYSDRQGLRRFGLFQWCCQPQFKRTEKKNTCLPFMPSTVQQAYFVKIATLSIFSTHLNANIDIIYEMLKCRKCGLPRRLRVFGVFAGRPVRQSNSHPV